MDSLHIEERLWEYIDGVASAAERVTIEKLLQSDAVWQKKYSELIEIHELVKATETEQPSMRFTKNVMEEIAKFKIAPATKSYINKKIIFFIAGFFVLVIAGFLVYGLFQVDWSTPTGSSQSLSIDFSKLDKGWNKYFNSTFVNIFLMFDAVVGLMLLDRYLKRKKAKESNA